MRRNIFLLLLLAANYCLSYSQPVTAFDSVASNLIGFSPANIYPAQIQDSFITKYHLRVDTIIEKTKKNYFYFRGFTKTYNPFSIPVDSIEVQLIRGKTFDPERNGYYIILIAHLPYEPGLPGRAKEEVTRLKTEVEKKIIPWNQSTSKKKASLQYEAFYFRSDYTSQFPHLGIGWATNSRKKKNTLTIRVAYSIN